jgi:Uma2 family endonuclease
MAIDLLPRPFTVDEYRLARRSGVFGDDRVELIDGGVVKMPPIGHTHWRRHKAISDYLNSSFGRAAYVVYQGSFPVEHYSEPQPDIAVLSSAQYGATGEVRAEGIFAMIEISDSSVQRDIGVKLRLYAHAQIADYFVIDVQTNVLLHFSEPHEGRYTRKRALSNDETFSLTKLPNIALDARPFLSTPIA